MIFNLPSNHKAAFKVLAKISEKTGVYLFLDKNKKPIYAGKAINLKNRITAHWRNLSTILRTSPSATLRTSSKERFFKTAKFLKIEILDSEVAALIRESELIKRFQPKLNVVFRDDKQYFYLCFSDEIFPRTIVLHQQKGLCLGPYTDGRALKNSLSLVRKAFPFCSCKTPHLRQCLNSQIGLCFGFCCEKNHSARATPEASARQATKKQVKQYQENIEKIKKIFSGKDKTLRKEVREQLERAVKNQDFETAQTLKLQLQGLEKVFSHQQHISEKQNFNLKELENLTNLKSIKRIEFFDSSQLQGSNRVAAMTVYHRVKSRQTRQPSLTWRGFENNGYQKNGWRLFKIKNEKAVDDLAMLREVFERRLNHPEWQKPDLIIVDGGKNQLKTALAIFSPAKIRAVSLTKNNRHQPEFLLIPDLSPRFEKSAGTSQPIKARVISLKTLSQPLKNFLEDFSDKTHGFAVRFHRKRRDKV